MRAALDKRSGIWAYLTSLAIVVLPAVWLP